MASKKQQPKEDPKIKQVIDLNETSILGITVESYSEKYIDRKKVTFYTVEIISHITQNTWKIEKRYSEFKKLQDILSKTFPLLPQSREPLFSK